MTESAIVARLLYIEDNEDNLYMLTLFFDVQGGYEILSAATGAEGIAKAVAERPDLILMDLNPSRDRRLGGGTAPEGRPRDARHPDYCADRACDGGGPREGAGERL